MTGRRTAVIAVSTTAAVAGGVALLARHIPRIRFVVAVVTAVLTDSTIVVNARITGTVRVAGRRTAAVITDNVITVPAGRVGIDVRRGPAFIARNLVVAEEPPEKR